MAEKIDSVLVDHNVVDKTSNLWLLRVGLKIAPVRLRRSGSCVSLLARVRVEIFGEKHAKGWGAPAKPYSEHKAYISIGRRNLAESPLLWQAHLTL